MTVKITKKTAVKKKVGKSVSSKSSSDKKTNSKSDVKKVVAKKRQSKTFKKVTSRVTKDEKEKAQSQYREQVSIPNNMSKRSVEKSAVLRGELDSLIRDSVYRVAYATGLCFLLVGTALAVSETINPAVLTSMSSSVSSSDLGSGDNPGTIPNPTLDFANTIPSQITEPFYVKFFAENYSGIEAELRNPGSDDRIPLNVHSLSNKEHKVIIPTNDLETGYYRLVIKLTPLSQSQSGLAFFDTPEFHVGEFVPVAEPVSIPEPKLVFIKTPPRYTEQPFDILFKTENARQVSARLINISNSNNEFSALVVNTLSDGKQEIKVQTDKLQYGAKYRVAISVEPLNGSGVQVFNTSSFNIGMKESDTADDDNEPEENDNTTTPKTDLDVETDTNTGSTVGAKEDVLFLIKQQGDNIFSGVELIDITTPKEYSRVNLYARPTQSLDVKFVTSAVKRLEKWQFVVNTLNLPNGKYEFFAKARNTNGEEVESKSIILTVKNEVATPKTTAENQNEPKPETFNLITLKDRSLPTIENEEFKQQFNPEIEAEREVDQLLRKNTDEVNDLLKRYAVAKQSGDEILIDNAKKAISKKKQSLVDDTLKDPRTREISDDINKELEERIKELQVKIDTFEQIRKDRSEGQTAIDTDKDGISDFDEINLYKTDPNAIDTDNDGFTDGVEIIRGYNPLDATPETSIHFESPKKSVGLVREDVLVVEEVIRVETLDAEQPNSQVKAEIRGRGLPNSFVTLYIFSAPTVVTIKTDADGMFVYTYDKELEDGSHDVYVAMTDNAGEIVAQSNPFSFIKTAQAFSTSDAVSENITTSEHEEVVIQKSNNIVIGLGILSLGLILLMLGIRFRPREEKIVASEDETGSSKPAESDSSNTSGKNSIETS